MCPAGLRECIASRKQLWECMDWVKVLTRGSFGHRTWNLIATQRLETCSKKSSQRCSRFQSAGEGEKEARAILITNRTCAEEVLSLLPLLPASSPPGILRHVQSGRCWPSALHTRHIMTILWSTRSPREKPYKALYGSLNEKKNLCFSGHHSVSSPVPSASPETPHFIGSWMLDETIDIKCLEGGDGELLTLKTEKIQTWKQIRKTGLWGDGRVWAGSRRNPSWPFKV